LIDMLAAYKIFWDPASNILNYSCNIL